ncbi:MAG: ArnT family glycosyltransferase [bacterium]
MKTFFHRFILTEAGTINHHLRLRHKVLFALILLLSTLIQLWGFTDPYVLAFETGFQELIARRHYQLGLIHTGGLSTLNTIGPEVTLHPTHPPLLQWVLAFFYWVFGEREASARLVSLISQFLILLGLWRVTRWSMSVQGRFTVLLTAAMMPLMLYAGRIVNFETPALACMVWSMVFLEEMIHRPSHSRQVLFYLVCLAGSLMDWTYQLFITCVLLTGFLRRDVSQRYWILPGSAWCLSMAVALAYAAVVVFHQETGSVLHHIRVRSGSMISGDGISFPTLLITLDWWNRLLRKLMQYSSPVLLSTLLIWLFWSVRTGKITRSLHYWCVTVLLFCTAYFLLFSNAAYNHYWCYFYFIPVFSLSFGLLAERLRLGLLVVLLLLTTLWSAEMVYEHRTSKPMLAAVQFGRVIDAANSFLSREQRTLLNSPILYTNRVDPLPYYSNLDTVFFYLSSGVPPEKFMLRYRPEFVTINGYTQNPDETGSLPYPPEILSRLHKSYTLVHRQFNIDLWESLWSPFLSIMGRIRLPSGKSPDTLLLADFDEVHVGAIFQPGEPGFSVDLDSITKLGKRWLYGYVIARGGMDSGPVEIRVTTDKGRELGTIQAIPQSLSPRWQPFWLYLGVLPDELHFSWQGDVVRFGDLRLISETAWTRDLTQLLAGEIERQLGSEVYPLRSIYRQGDQRFPTVLHHPGKQVDQVELPPLRVGYDESLIIRYGIHPRAKGKTDGVNFRIHVRDFALGTIELLLDDVYIFDETMSEGEVWRTKVFDLHKYSRHVLQFTFEVKPVGGYYYDHALWKDALIVPKEQVPVLLGESG